MRIHYLQHMPFEDLGNIASWAMGRGHRLSRTLLYEGESLPAVSDFDWLVILGGVMNVYEHDRHPWLVPEKEFIAEAIERGKIVLGVCLGAQLISDVLGGKVTRNAEREIGWFPVWLTRENNGSSLFRGFPERFTPFHWHGDRFSIPPGAVHLAGSEACDNQAFQFGDRVLGIQFHLDYTPEGIETMIRNCADELTDGPFVQSPEQMRCAPGHFPTVQALLNGLLGAMDSTLKRNE
jgi:GMP synthase-like glutamine amidotransferase